MRIRLYLLSLIIVGLALSCQSAPEANGADGSEAAGTEAPGAPEGPTTEELAADLEELRRENRELTRRLGVAGEALDRLEADIGAAVAPEEASLSQEELLGRARALRQENQALRRVIDELLYLDTLGGVDYTAPIQGEPIPELPPGTTRRRRRPAEESPTASAGPETPEPTAPAAPAPEADQAPTIEPPPVAVAPPVAPPADPEPESPEPPAAQQPRSPAPVEPRSTSRPPAAGVTREGFLETEILAVPPRSAPGRQQPPLGEVIALRLVDDRRVSYVDRRANFLSESPVFLALKPEGNSFALTLWGVARYPGSEPPLSLRSLIVQTPTERYIFEPTGEQLCQ